MGAKPDSPLIVHATAVAVANRAVLILGASGAGKSALGLQLMACGAGLVSDDRTCLSVEAGTLVARAPGAIAGLIEARGIGLLRADAVPSARIFLVVDLDRTETARMPETRRTAILGIDLPCLHKIDSPHFSAAILQYLKRDQEEAP